MKRSLLALTVLAVAGGALLPVSTPADAAPGGDAVVVVQSATVDLTGNTSYHFLTKTTMCPAGMRATGGGAFPTSTDVLHDLYRTYYSAPVDATGLAGSTDDQDVPRGWQVTINLYQVQAGDPNFHFFAICSANSDATIAALRPEDDQETATVPCPAGTRAIGGGVGRNGDGPIPNNTSATFVLFETEPVDSTGTVAGTQAGDVATGWRSRAAYQVYGRRYFAICSAASDATVATTSFTTEAVGGAAGGAGVACPAGQRALSGGLGTDTPPADGNYRPEIWAPVTAVSGTPGVVTGSVPLGFFFTGKATDAHTTTYRVFALCATDTSPPDTTPPDTTITKGPKKKTTSTKATFTFSSEAGATFTCQRDKKNPVRCESPYKLKHLKPGKHKLTVAATDAAGNADPTPAVFKWKVLEKKPHHSSCTGECRESARAAGGDVITVVKDSTLASSGTITPMCPSGTRAIGGGAAPVSPNATAYASRFNNDGPVDAGGGQIDQGEAPGGWTVTVESAPSGALGSWRAFATCSASTDAVATVHDFTSGPSQTFPQACPAGQRAVGGGLVGAPAGSLLARSGPRDSLGTQFGHSADGSVPTIWEVDVAQPTSGRAVVICSTTSDATLRGVPLTVPAGDGTQAATATASCPAGQRAVSGGLAGDPATVLGENRLSFAAPATTVAGIAGLATGATPQAWTLQARGTTGAQTYQAYAICITAPPPADTSAPDTTIGKGPKKKTTSTKATFTFSSEAGATFTCQRDKKSPVRCESPYKLKHLKPGKHKLTVAATDAAGNTDPTPAVFKWKVLRKKRPTHSGCTGECRMAADGYTTYVACSYRASADPATACRLAQKKAAFFRSAKHDASYRVCVKFPGKKKRLCASAQDAPKGRTESVTIATADTGRHTVTWYVAGTRVGTWRFAVTP